MKFRALAIVFGIFAQVEGERPGGSSKRPNFLDLLQSLGFSRDTQIFCRKSGFKRSKSANFFEIAAMAQRGYDYTGLAVTTVYFIHLTV